MNPRAAWTAWAGIALAACSAPHAATLDAAPTTTASAIAIANLDHLIAQRGDEGDIDELLFARSRFLGDYDALDRASTLAELRPETARDLLQRARARAAVHRFAAALDDLAALERTGGSGDAIAGARASIFVATGRAHEVVAQLEGAAHRQPGYASSSALAGAYAAVGRYADADRLYVAALDALDTTSPFPYAWIYFARGVMWAEHGSDPVRGEALYRRALAYVPEFVTAAVHLSELEVTRGELRAPIARLAPIAAASREPEALALLGALHIRTGDRARGEHEIASARERYESLLARHPLAFADHAAEFYLGPGADAERAWALARQNLAGRRTDRAFALAIEAAWASKHYAEACDLTAQARAAPPE